MGGGGGVKLGWWGSWGRLGWWEKLLEDMMVGSRDFFKGGCVGREGFVGVIGKGYVEVVQRGKNVVGKLL